MDYVSNTDEELSDMLRKMSVGSIDELLRCVPSEIRSGQLDVPPGLSETEIIAECERLAGRNRPVSDTTVFLGAGSYQHTVPTVVDSISSRGEWLTPYTPYQAEASQGSLQAIYEFQTMICELLQMDLANASLYDGASAAAEAVIMAMRATERERILLSEALNPHIRAVIATYLSGADVVIQDIPSVGGITDIGALNKAIREDVSCFVAQQPNVFGCLEPMQRFGELVHGCGGLFIASVYPISLGLLRPPGAYGADIAVGEGGCLGSPISAGGPALGLFATKEKFIRRVPGRFSGCSVDVSGCRAFTLTLQTREQHIRREKATSNICTNEGWIALRAAIFLSLLGLEGFKELAVRNFEKAHYARQRLLEIPWVHAAFDQPFFNEFTLRYDCEFDAESVNRSLMHSGIVGGLPLAGWYPALKEDSLWCVTERMQREEIDRAVRILKAIA